MKKNTKICAFLLCICLAFASAPLFAVTSSAATTMTPTLFASKLAELKNKYPNGGKYSGDVFYVNVNGRKIDVGSNCHGFANYAAWLIFGSYAAAYGNGNDVTANWKITRGSAGVTNLHAGDVVRFASGSKYDHTIFITAVNGNTVTYCDANSKLDHITRYNNSTTKSALAAKVNANLVTTTGEKKYTGWVAHYKYWQDAPVLSINYSANGGEIAGSVIGTNYTVVTKNGLNVRSGPGTGYSIVGGLSTGDRFVVSTNAETGKGSGYTWAKVTVGSLNGWVAISDSSLTRSDGPVRNSKYYVDSDMIYLTSSGKKHTQVLTYGEKIDSGLYNTATFGLTRPGCAFIGWSTALTGAEIFDEDRGLCPEEIVPSLKDGDQTVTLYAVWGLYGDANTDGKVNLVDVVVILKYIAGWDVTPCIKTSDVNLDGKITLIDVTLMLKKLAGWDVVLGTK